MEVASMSGLIEGLPDAVALMCLARVPYYIHPRLELVSRSWKAAIHSAELFRARWEIGSSEDLLCVCSYDPNNTWQIYDPIRDLWMTLPELPSKSRHLSHFGAVSISQKLFVLGGRSDAVDPSTGDHDDNFSINEVWSYNPVTRKWSTQAPMLVPRASFSCCVLNGKIIVAGGFTGRSKSTPTAEMYDPEKDSWVVLPGLLQTHYSECSGVVIGGNMHIIYQGLSTVQVFDNLEMKWRVEDYGWLAGPMAAVQDSVYVMSQGLIFKQDGQQREVVVSASKFCRIIGMAMIGFRDELYVIGGVPRPERLDGEFILLSDVHVLTLEGEKPTWRNAAPMTRCRGTVLGCTQLRI